MENSKSSAEFVKSLGSQIIDLPNENILKRSESYRYAEYTEKDETKRLFEK